MPAAIRSHGVSRRRPMLRWEIAAVCVAMVLAACTSSSAAPTPIPTEFGATPSLAVASAAASGASSGGGTGSAAPSASVDTNVDPQLEAIIPADVSGIHLDVVSVTGDVFVQQQSTSPLADLFPDVDVAPESGTVAVGTGGSPAEVIVVAMRFPGVVRARLSSAFRARITTMTANATFKDEKIDGHDVLEIIEPGQASPTYVRFEDGLLMIVLAGDPNVALAALHGLHAPSG